MKVFSVAAVLIPMWGLAAVAQAQKSDTAKPKAQLVSVVGCAGRTPDNGWILTKASQPIETPRLFSSTKEIEEAKKAAFGNNRFKLVGTAEFVTKEELLKTQQRGEFTRPEVANATGQLQEGKKLVMKGLLITEGNEKRLNLVSVQQTGLPCSK
jgi:hypothetical protein